MIYDATSWYFYRYLKHLKTVTVHQGCSQPGELSKRKRSWCLRS